MDWAKGKGGEAPRNFFSVLWQTLPFPAKACWAARQAVAGGIDHNVVKGQRATVLIPGK